MKKFKFWYSRTLGAEIEVEAENEEKAFSKAQEIADDRDNYDLEFEEDNLEKLS